MELTQLEPKLLNASAQTLEERIEAEKKIISNCISNIVILCKLLEAAGED